MPRSVYRYILTRTYRSQIVVVGLTLALLPLAPVPLELQRRMLDDAVATKDLELLGYLGLLYLGAMLLAAALKFGMRTQREYISASVVRMLRRSVFFNLYTHAPAHREALTDEVDEGAVVSIMSSEVEKLGGFAGSAISGPLFEVGTLISILGYMFYVEPLVASIAVALYSPQLVLVPLFQIRMNRLAREKALKVRDLGSFLVENDEDVLLRRDPPETFNNLVEVILGIRRKFILTKQSMKTINNVLIALGPFSVISFGGYLVIQGEAEIGVIVAFVSGLERLGSPIRELVGSYSQIMDARMRYETLLSAFPDELGEPAAGPGQDDGDGRGDSASAKKPKDPVKTR
ncbi:MAG: ABC transporter transmembrane domain-containing protein [Pseudomonadota bacterium]